MATKELRAGSRAEAALPAKYDGRTNGPWSGIRPRAYSRHGKVDSSTSPAGNWRRIQAVLQVGDAIALFIGFAVPLLLVAEYGPPSPEAAIIQALVLTSVGLWSMRF